MSTFRKFDINEEPITLDYIRCGIKGLDQLFGGGLPLNNLILIEEDEFNVYSSLMLKSIASYVAHEKINLTYFSDAVPNDVPSFLQKLPTRCRSDAKSMDGPKDMQIAFRYNYMPSLDMETGLITDFGRLVEEKMIKSLFNLNGISVYPMDKMAQIIARLTNCTNPPNGSSSTSSNPHLIIIDHLSSTCPKLTSDNICASIYSLKSLVRQLSKCTIIITTQSGWLPVVMIKRLRNICDSAIQLEAFDPLEPSVYSDDYKGALHVHKVTRLSSAKDSIVANLGFQMKKNNRHFVVEKLFLPPDIGETPSRVPTKPNVGDEIF